MRTHNKIATATITFSLLTSLLYSAPFKPLTTALDNNPDAKAVPMVKVGNPYEIKGIKYNPKNPEEYDVVGLASWYGDKFHGQLTANGEIFDMNELTAASPVLPMPSFVQVTNLDNNKQIIVRVNDRGPFAGGRLLDVSKRTAELLGFKENGTTQVRIKLLSGISKEAAKEINKQNDIKLAAAKKELPANPTMPATPVASNDIPVAHAVASKEPELQLEQASDTPRITKGEIPMLENSSLVDSADTNEPLNNTVSILQDSNDQEMKNVNLTEPQKVKSYLPRGVFVQVGAFSENNKKVRSEVASLSDVGVVSLQKVDVNGSDILRLRVGPYGSINDAIQVKNKLVKLGYNKSRVVVEQ